MKPKPIQMFECSDGTLFKDEEEGQEREDQLALIKEVDDFLDSPMSTAAAHTKSAKRDLLIPLWPALEGYFTRKSAVVAAEVKEGE